MYIVFGLLFCCVFFVDLLFGMFFLIFSSCMCWSGFLRVSVVCLLSFWVLYCLGMILAGFFCFVFVFVFLWYFIVFFLFELIILFLVIFLSRIFFC